MLYHVHNGIGANETLGTSKRRPNEPRGRRALRNKTTICKFLFEDIIYKYKCAGKIVPNRGELNVI